MTVSVTLSRKMLVGLLIIVLFLLLLLSIRWVSAQSEGRLLNVCIKNDKIRVVANPDECDQDKETASSLVTGEGLQALEAENAALKSLVRRLHRNSAAVIDVESGGFSSSGIYTEIKFRLEVCPEEDFEGGFCSNPDVLEWTLAEADEETTLSMASGDGDFDAIVTHLTDGQSDIVCTAVELGGIGVSCSPERVYFRDFAGPITTDLAGFNLDQISLAVDRLLFLYPSDGGTEYDLRGRLFYELAD